MYWKVLIPLLRAGRGRVRVHQWMSGYNPLSHFVLSGWMRKWDMMYGICAIWKTPVEVRRNGVGAFLVQLFGHKKSLQGWKSTPCRLFRAEREGFEPPVPLSTAVFKTAVIDHSTTSPIILRCAWCFKASAKVMGFSETSKYFRNFFQKKCIFLYFSCFLGSWELGVSS